MLLKDKTVFITGASRGIGLAIAKKLAAEGANIVVAAKTVTAHPKLEGTIYTAATEIEATGAKALPLQLDIREEEQIVTAVNKAVEKFGGIDVLINNASAIALTGTTATSAKQFDLMHDINVRGTFLMTKACLPFLQKGNNAHIITLSPPLNIIPKWLGDHIAYTMAKFNMTMMALGWAEEYKTARIASNALWPKTTIDTAAVRNLLGGEQLANMSRKPDILADAVHYILQQPSSTYTGQALIDEDVLAQAGITNLDQYAVVPGAKLYTDLFL